MCVSTSHSKQHKGSDARLRTRATCSYGADLNAVADASSPVVSHVHLMFADIITLGNIASQLSIVIRATLPREQKLRGEETNPWSGFRELFARVIKYANPIFIIYALLVIKFLSSPLYGSSSASYALSGFILATIFIYIFKIAFEEAGNWVDRAVGLEGA